LIRLSDHNFWFTAGDKSLIALKHPWVDRPKRRHVTMVLLIAGQEVVSFGSGSLFGFGFGQDFTHLAFVLNFNL
jgi:hypothetical protein